MISGQPTTVGHMHYFITHGWGFTARPFDLDAATVQVMSGHPFTQEQREHPLTNSVAEGAEWVRTNYLDKPFPQARQYHPDVVVYYLRDRRTGKVIAGVQQNGTVLDEIATMRPDLRPATIHTLRDALSYLPSSCFSH